MGSCVGCDCLVQRVKCVYILFQGLFRFVLAGAFLIFAGLALSSRLVPGFLFEQMSEALNGGADDGGSTEDSAVTEATTMCMTTLKLPERRFRHFRVPNRRLYAA